MIPLCPSRNFKRWPKNFSLQPCLKALNFLAIAGLKKILILPMVFSSMGTGPQRGKFTHPKTRKDLSKQCSEPPLGWSCLGLS